jgi:hypothetical protein
MFTSEEAEPKHGSSQGTIYDRDLYACNLLGVIVNTTSEGKIKFSAEER